MTNMTPMQRIDACTAAPGEFRADVASGTHRRPCHLIPMSDCELDRFLAAVDSPSPALAAE